MNRILKLLPSTDAASILTEHDGSNPQMTFTAGANK